MVCLPAEVPSRLLGLLVPASVWRAERALLCGEVTEAHLRELLEFHQRTVEPLSCTFSFALPCDRALDAIARHCGPEGLVEIGAGTGLWAALLRRRGLAVHAYDQTESASRFGPVSLGGPESVPHHPGASLLLCWPPLEDFDGGTNMMAVDALRLLSGPGALLYVGEWRGATGLVSQLSDRTVGAGMMSGPRFQAFVQREWECVETVQVLRWPGMADRLYVFRRREPGLSAADGIYPADVFSGSAAGSETGRAAGSTAADASAARRAGCLGGAEFGAAKSGAAESGAAELGPAQVGAAESGGAQVGTAQFGAAESWAVGPGNGGTSSPAAPWWRDDGDRPTSPCPVVSSRGARLRLLRQVHAPGREWAWMAANVAWEAECAATAGARVGYTADSKKHEREHDAQI